MKNRDLQDIVSDLVGPIYPSADSAIDWEQRRYEIAKDALAGIISEESIPGTDPFHYIDKDVSRAIEYADELIKHLKSK